MTRAREALGLDVGDVAALLGVSKDAVYSWVSTKGIPGHRGGRFLKVKRDEVDEWVQIDGAGHDNEYESREPRSSDAGA